MLIFIFLVIHRHISIEKNGVLAVATFQQILADEGPILLADPEKIKIKRLFVNIKEETLAYQAVLQSLDFSG